VKHTGEMRNLLTVRGGGGVCVCVCVCVYIYKLLWFEGMDGTSSILLEPDQKRGPG
jgi:hypothetical protein